MGDMAVMDETDTKLCNVFLVNYHGSTDVVIFISEPPYDTGSYTEYKKLGVLPIPTELIKNTQETPLDSGTYWGWQVGMFDGNWKGIPNKEQWEKILKNAKEMFL